jgi:SAM-dependent methyltransferase
MMDAITFARKMLNRSRRLYRGATQLMRHGYEEICDWRDGVHTAGNVQLEGLSVVGSSRDSGVRYEPIPRLLFDLAMERLDIAHEDYVFVDLGSGKGRTLLAASHYPFRELVGIEFARELHDIARSNLREYRHTRDRRWQVRHGDARDFRFPDENIVLFLFNPFDATVMHGVLDNILAWRRASAKSIFIVYCNARHSSVFDSCADLALRDEIAVPHLFGLPAGYIPAGYKIYGLRDAIGRGETRRPRQATLRQIPAVLGALVGGD